MGVNYPAHLVRLFGIAAPIQFAAHQYFASNGHLDSSSLLKYGAAAAVLGLSQWYGINKAPMYAPEYVAHWAGKPELESMHLSLEDLQNGIGMGYGYKRLTGIRPGLANRSNSVTCWFVDPRDAGRAYT